MNEPRDTVFEMARYLDRELNHRELQINETNSKNRKFGSGMLMALCLTLQMLSFYHENVQGKTKTTRGTYMETMHEKNTVQKKGFLHLVVWPFAVVFFL